MRLTNIQLGGMYAGNMYGLTSWKTIATEVMYKGYKRESRLGNSWEMIGTQVVFSPYVIPRRHGMARRLAMVELLQVISAYFDERHILHAAPKLLYEYGLTHAYGIKVAQQLEAVVAQLRSDPTTRRAKVYIGKPEDGYEVEKPCMQDWQFISSDGEILHMVAGIRSWDAVSGMPYDAPVMGGILQLVAGMTAMIPGQVYANAGSLHVYEKDAEKIETIEDAQLFFLEWKFGTFRQAREWAIDQLNSLDSWGRSGVPDGVVLVSPQTDWDMFKTVVDQEQYMYDSIRGA